MLKICDVKLKQGRFNLSIENLFFKAGDLILLIGPNGSGKTTFLKALAGLINYTGDVFINDTKSESLGFKERAKNFGYLPQRISFSEMLVKDFILLGRFPYTRILSGYSENDFNVAKKTATDFGVCEYLDRDVSGLSQGEFQRVMLAKVFAQSPKVLLLDEPTTSLDIGYKHSVREQILDYKKANKDSVIVISTHEPELFENFSDGFVMLKNGKVFKHGSQNLYSRNDFNELFDLK